MGEPGGTTRYPNPAYIKTCTPQCWERLFSNRAERQKQRDGRRANAGNNDLTCAFVFLAESASLHHPGDDDLTIAFVFFVVCTKPVATLVLSSFSGSPSAVGKEPESATAPVSSGSRGTSRRSRGQGHGPPVRLQKRGRLIFCLLLINLYRFTCTHIHWLAGSSSIRAVGAPYGSPSMMIKRPIWR
jgi:hypothetical protein